MLEHYLSNADQGATSHAQHILSINETLRENRIARDRRHVSFNGRHRLTPKALFRFAETDSRTVTNGIKPMDDSLQLALKTSVPGLVNSQPAAEIGAPSEAITAEDQFAVGRHRLIVPSSPFNAPILFQPTILFIEQACNVIPPGFEDEPRHIGAYMEDFVVQVFLPQLEERVTSSFNQAISGEHQGCSRGLNL